MTHISKSLVHFHLDSPTVTETTCAKREHHESYIDSKCLLIAYYEPGTKYFTWIFSLFTVQLNTACLPPVTWNSIKIVVSKYESLVSILLPLLLAKRTSILFMASICQTNFPVFFVAKSNYVTMYEPMKRADVCLRKFMESNTILIPPCLLLP